ncbi:hypothetical protein EDB19DRAFT_173103 [Suillus lakei]|nr:hypothetical protein EDB19DRAFT_173103 [Suillus lakei]
MANNTGANASKMPLCMSTFSAELKSATQADGSAVDSGYISTLYLRNKGTEVEGHSSDVVWFHEFEGTSTTKIRRAPALKDAAQCSCILLHIIVSRKLLPITTLSGDEFLVAWWRIVTCHRTLWKMGMRHRNVSLSNFMGYRLGGQFISVLNDFDLSSIKQHGPIGFERTGTIPFMALDLLMSEAIASEVEHVYYHDAESFIWVLTWVCLRYEKGELLRKGRPLDEWLTVDAMGCHEKKTSFLAMLRRIRPTRSHGGNFKVAKDCLAMIIKLIDPSTSVPGDDEEVFQTWLQNHVRKLEGD